MARYSNIPTITNSNGNKIYPRIKYPNIPLSPSDAYIICGTTDRYDKLAQDYYEDSSLWWVISLANNSLPQNTLFPPEGSYIRIPASYIETLNEFNRLNDTSDNINPNSGTSNVTNISTTTSY